MPFGMEKLEWWVYPTVKKFRRYVYSFWQNSRTWRTHTHRHCIGRNYAYHRATKTSAIRSAVSTQSTSVTYATERTAVAYMALDSRATHWWHSPRILPPTENPSGGNPTECTNIFKGKILNNTPDPILPNRRGPDHNRPTGGYVRGGGISSL